MPILSKLTWVEIKLFLREPMTMVFTFALPVIFVFVMGGVFGNKPSADVFRGVGPMDYYVPAYFGLVLAAIGVVALPVHLTAYRERGILRRLRTTPVSPLIVMVAQVVVVFVMTGLGVLLLASAYLYQRYRKAIQGFLAG